MPSRKKAQGRERKATRELVDSCIVCSMSKKISCGLSQSFCTHGHDHTNYDPKEIMMCGNFIRQLFQKGYVATLNCLDQHFYIYETDKIKAKKC